MNDLLKQLNLPQDQTKRLLLFMTRLMEWNKTHNLTAIETPEKIFTHHLLDSLSVGGLLTANNVLDLGTGAGFPGLVLAIVLPDKQFTLLDSRSKKIHFLRQMISELQCDNAQAIHVRAEDFQPLQQFDGIICRAVGSIADVIRISSQLLAKHGAWYFMKGPNYQEELKAVTLPYDIYPIMVPGLNEQRVLIIVKNDPKI